MSPEVTTKWIKIAKPTPSTSRFSRRIFFFLFFLIPLTLFGTDDRGVPSGGSEGPTLWFDPDDITGFAEKSAGGLVLIDDKISVDAPAVVSSAETVVSFVGQVSFRWLHEIEQIFAA